jgi:prophage antirepressor-like protein
LQSFGFGDQLVRVVERESGVWFVGNDVCAALEIKNSRDAIARLDDDERDCVGIADAMRRQRETTIISESGVYALIFTSRKAVAITFRKWVTGEVLPALRRDGRYAVGANDDEDEDEAIGIDVPHLGSMHDRDKIKTAVSVVRMYERNWGPAAARAMAVKLGFPMLDIDLPAPAPASVTAAPSDAVAAAEGDMVRWGEQVKLTASRSAATHRSELYDSYARWCSLYRWKAMHPDRFERMLNTLFGTEEHPEMYRCVMKRP